MQAQPRSMAAAGPRLSTATRSHTGDPARAGSIRLAALAGLVALAAGAATLLATRQILIDTTLAQLETVRAAVAADIGRFTRGLTDATGQLATDPRLATFLREAQRRNVAPHGRGDDAPAAKPPRW